PGTQGWGRERALIRNSEFWGGLFWLALGGAIAWAGYDLGLGKLHEPGSGFMLFWLGLIMLALAACVVLTAALSGGRAISSLWSDTRWGKVLLVVAVLLVFAFAFEAVGFIPGSLALLLFLMFLIDPVDWKIAIPVSVLATVGVWAAMTKWLKIQL